MNILKDWFEIFNNLTEQQELAAIWLNKPLITGEGRTSRIAPDATVCVKGGLVIDCSNDNKATHKVIGCIGTLYNHFEITVIDLLTNEPMQIKL